MDKIYKFLLILVLCAVVACDEDVPGPVINKTPLDTKNPLVQLTSPAANTSYLIINRPTITAMLSDNMGLGSARALLVDGDGQRREVVEPFPFYGAPKHEEFWSVFSLRDIEPGIYRLVLEVRDKQNNLAKDSVTIKVHAPDINRTEFAKAFKEGSLYHQIDWSWFGLDFINGLEFNESDFSTALYLMVKIDEFMNQDEWEMFMKDFRFENQTWSSWDEDSNGELDNSEFKNGIGRLDLFNKWDSDSDRFVREDELINGIFDSWDEDRDNLLTRAEYAENFYNYLVLF